MSMLACVCVCVRCVSCPHTQALTPHPTPTHPHPPRNPDFEALFPGFTHFNPIQTQVCVWARGGRLLAIS